MAWDYDKAAYDTQAQADPVWALERALNYGTQGKKLDRALLKRHLPQLNITENTRVFLELILWNKKF